MRNLVPITKLTPAEGRILDFLCENGAGDREIAERFGIATETAKRHISNILDKTGYGSRMELAVNTLHKRYAEHSL